MNRAGYIVYRASDNKLMGAYFARMLSIQDGAMTFHDGLYDKDAVKASYPANQFYAVESDNFDLIRNVMEVAKL